MTQVVLGLPFKEFKRLKRRRESDYRENEKLRKEIRELKSENLWKFLKRKFKGV